ncbi:hypothetical protein VBD025_06315 [Virgibacillus flavescens]|uniref:hypothetical protein n=1 Tax=Virgibacillus flavescens TaxID=1611422 RepID=UPI003D34F0FA
MKVRIGVIGPADSMQRIMYVAQECDDVEFIPCIYKNLSDINALLEKNKGYVDQWLFSGVLNFTYASEMKLITDEIASFPPLHGSSFFGTLLEAQLNEKKVYEKVSIDTIAEEELAKILSYYKLESLHYYSTPFKGYQHTSSFIDFHKQLYDEGKIEVVITPIKETYFGLKKLGIPVYRVTPSYLSIQLTIQLLRERAQSNRYKNAQMAVVGCKIEFNSEKQDDLYYSFKMKHFELDLKRSLLLLTEKVNGSLMHLGDGLFFIFTTRGEIKGETEMELFHLINDVKAQSNIKMEIAVGLGETVSQAEQNVRYGFRNSKTEESTIVMIDENQSISLKNPRETDFSYKTMEINKDQNSVNPAVISKIQSYVNQYNRSEFTSQDLSRWLKSTERNGRRILTLLDQANIIEACGKAQQSERGRPRKVYRFIK